MAKQEAKQVAQDAVDLSELPLNTLEDYRHYARQARKLGRPVKIPPGHLHKQVKFKFERFDQPENVLKFIVVNENIDWRGELIPGQIYTLPEPVVTHLNNRSVPIYGEVPVNDGGPTRTETKLIGERSRFNCKYVG